MGSTGETLVELITLRPEFGLEEVKVRAIKQELTARARVLSPFFLPTFSVSDLLCNLLSVVVV